MASGRKAKEFEHQFTLSQEQRDEYRQALAQQVTQADVQKTYDDAKAQVQSYWNKPVNPAEYTERLDAWRRYQAATNYLKGYTQLTGQLTEQSFQSWRKGIQAEYEKAAQREGQALQLAGKIRQNPTKALGLQTAAGIAGDEALREATTANKLPGLLDEKTGLPTEATWAAWEKNRQRAAYQDAAQTAADSGAIRSKQYAQAQETLELLDDAITALEKMQPTKDARVLSSQQGIMRSYAEQLGITDYADRDDLLRQLRAQLGRQTRRSDRQAAAAAEQAGRYRTALALEYQLDNPDESLDANYLKRQRDEAKRAYEEKKTFRTRDAYEKAEAAYQEQKYRDDQEKTILEIRQDGGLSKQYQTALEAERWLTAAETALQYVKSDLERDGAVNRDTLGQVQQITGAAGLTLPAGKTDNELRAYLEKLTAKYRSDKNFTLANLAHAGYDADKLEQYITRALNAQKMDEYTGQAADFAADSPVGASAASSAANLVSGMGYLAALPRTVANAWNIHTGNPEAYIPMDENSDAFRATRYAETIRQEVAQQLQGKTDGKTAAFLYDTGMSMLDNILQVGVGMGLLGAPAMAEAAASGGVSAAVAAGSAAASPVSLGMMGLTTASQKLLEMTDEGVDTTTAYNLATAAGAIEVLTEKIGLDEFINGLGRQTAATTLRRIGQQVGRQTLAEGTEEAASDVLNLAADLLLRMDQADFVRDIDKARRQGLTQGEAVWSVVEDQLKQTGLSFAGGALSGALFGLGGAAMNAVSSTDRAMGRQLQRTGGMEQLQKDAAAYGLNADNLTRESSPKELGAMQRQVYRAQESTAREIEAFARQKGYKKAAADALQEAWQGYKETGLNELSPQEFGVAFDTAYQEGKLDAQYGRTGAYLERAATDALTAGLLPETVKYAYLAGTKDGSRAASRAQSPVQALQERAAERRARRAEAAATAATGAVQPGGGLTVMQLDDYTAKLRTAEGKTVTADQLETDAPERQIILQAQDDGYGPQEANALLAHYDGSMAPEAYYEQFREAITAGQDGESLTEARRRAGSGLTAEATKAAWELGQEIQTFLDTDERVGPAGKQALDAMAYGDAGLFEAYYKAGLAGESFAEARGRIGQMTDALEAKLRAAVKAGVRDAQGGFSYGKQEPNRDAGRGRVRDVGARREDGTVESVAETDAGGEGAAVEAAAGRTDAAGPGGQEREVAGQKKNADSDERVSAQELGIGNGTDRKALRVIRPEQLTQEQREVKAELRKQGITLTFVEGHIELTGRDQATHYAKGVCVKQKNAIVVRTDAKMPWQKIVKHEAQHMAFAKNPALLDQTWRKFLAHMEMAEIERWIAGYAERYGGLYDAADLEGLIEEALCDVAAEVDAPAVSQRYWKEEFPQRKEAWKQGRNVSDAALYQMDQDTGGRADSDSYSLDDKISMGLDDAARYQILKDRSLTAAKVDPRELGGNSTEKLEQLAKANKSVAFRLLKKIGEEFGVFRDYKTEAFNLEFAFSKRNLLESVNKQGSRYDNYALMLTQMEDIVENAVGIETHNKRYGEEGQIKQTYVFVSAMQTSENIVPILLEVRAFNDGTKSTLRIAVSMSEIKRSRVMGHTLEDARSDQSYPTGFAVRIADLFANVNSRDGRLLKYIPDGFLKEAQRDGKQAALQEQAAYDSRKKAQRDSRKAQDDRYSAEDDAESRDLARELDDALKRNKALESVNRRLREQMKVTPPGTADPASLRQAAKRLSEEYGGALRQKDIAADLQKIWRLRSEGKRGQMMEQVDKLAAELVQHYLDKDNPEAETLREIKQTVRATKIQLTPALRADLDREGGYQDFRRRNYGRIRLANSGLGVDQFYQELSERWPAYFPAGIWNPADQLIQIADAIQDGTTILQHSPMEAFPDGMTYMRNRVLWELGLVQPAKPTAADKVIRQAADAANRDALLDAAGAHEQEQIDKLTAWHQKQLQKVKADREDRIQKVKARYQERAQAERDWKAEQELKRRLLWHGNKLKRMSRTATPEQQEEIARIFGDINLACQRMTGEVVIKDYIQGMSTEEIRPEGYRDKADPRRTMSVEEGFWHPEVRGDKVVDVERLKAWYEDQKKTNPDFIADGRVEDILANWEKKQINTMTPQEVQQLLDVALNIENEIRTQKKLIDAEDRREIYQQVLQIVGDIEGTRGRYDRGKLSRPAQWITENTLTPVRLLRRWTGFHDSDPLYQAALALQDGELKQLDYQRRAYEKFEEFTKDKKFMDHLAGKGKQRPIEVTGVNEKGETVTVKITPDMRVALYLHSRNYQNLRHIQRGGITVPQYEAYVKGDYTEAYDRGTRLRLMPRDVRAITDKMTTREKNYAERVAQYYDTMSKAEINGVSVKLKGYEIAKVQRYYPIETDKAFIAKEFDALRYDGSVEGKGFLKERQEGGNPILLRDATRTLQKSIRDHALYVGMAIPIRNFNKLRGVSISKSDETGALRYQENSLMKALEEKWGTQAVKHMERMVADLSGAQPPQASGTEMLNRIRSNYAGAVLELNPSTALKQLIAYPSAASVLGWDAMAVGLTKWQRVNVKLIGQYTPLLWHRMQGYIDADLGDYAKNHGHTPRLLNWNQAGDLAVIKQIWKAAEWKVAHDDRTLLHDVEKWHKATAELFNRVVLESQANYTTMERGEILRTNNVFLRSIAMFKTEPFQAFNVLYDAFANTAAKRRQLAALQQQGEQATEEELTTAENAYRDAKKRIAQAVPAVIASNLLEASIVFAWALFRGKDKDWRDEETDEITAASFFKQLALTAAGNISGIIPYGSEITDLLQSAIGGDRYYGIDLLEASALTDMAETLLDIKNTVAKMFEKKETDEERLAAWGDTAKELVDETLRVLQTLGLPAANIHKSVDAIARWALRLALGKDAGEYTYRYYTQESTATGRAAEDAETLLQLALDGEDEKLERVYEMATRIREADDVGEAVKKRIQARVKSGTLDVETAAALLERFQPDKDADELYWNARGWAYKAQNGADSFTKYTILKDALRSGGNAEAALKELEEHGVERDAAVKELRSQIGAWYKGTSDDGKTIQKTEAMQLLQKYGDENEREAEETVREWTCEKETGYAYSELSAAMVDGEITKEQAVDWLQRYGGKEKEAAQSTVKKWTCEKETGYAYGELREALQDGEVTEKNVAKWLQQYGGKDEEDAKLQAAAWVFAGKHPELADQYGDEALESIANSYAKYGAGIPAAQFAKYKQDLDKIEGDPDGEGGYKRNTRKPKVYAYIAQLPLTPEQKDSLVHVASGSYNLKGTPW